MRKNLFVLLILFVAASCSQNVIEKSEMNNVEKNIDVSNFIKDINGNIVDKIPLDVYDRLVTDLNDSGKFEVVNILKNYYIKDTTAFVLKKDFLI